MTTDIQLKEVEIVLSGLNALDADEIALELRDQGFRGKQIISDCCPIANFVKAKTGAQIWICDSVYDAFVGGAKITNETPSNVGKFVRNFDGDQYPFLQE